MRDEDVGDRLGGHPAERRQGCRCVGLCCPRVDRDHAVLREDERDVREIVSLGDVDARGHLDEPGRAEAEAVLGGHPGVRGEDRQAGIERRIARALERRLGLALAAECRERAGEAPVDAAPEADGEAVLVVEDPLQIRHRRGGLLEASRELGEHEPAEVARDPGISGDRAVELGHRRIHPSGPTQEEHVARDAGLEEALEREEQRAIGRISRSSLEVGIGLLVASGCDESSHEGEDGADVRVRPADRLLKGLQLQIAHQRALRCLAARSPGAFRSREQRPLPRELSFASRSSPGPAPLPVMRMHHR